MTARGGFFQSLVLSLLTLVPGWLGFAQEQPDPALLAEIQKIKAVDNHTHVPRVDLAGEADDEYDALPCGSYVEPTADNVMVRPDNPEYLAAWKALWGYRYDDRAPAHVEEVVAAKARARAVRRSRRMRLRSAIPQYSTARRFLISSIRLSSASNLA